VDETRGASVSSRLVIGSIAALTTGLALFGIPHGWSGRTILVVTHRHGLHVADLVALGFVGFGLAPVVWLGIRGGPEVTRWFAESLPSTLLGIGVGITGTAFGNASDWLWVPGAGYVAWGLLQVVPETRLGTSTDRMNGRVHDV
jgi:hypothetical protein